MLIVFENAVGRACSGHNLLIHGPCSIGKSVVLRRMHKDLERLGKKVAVTASSGVAASLFDRATTLHHWAGLNDGRYNYQQLLEYLTQNEAWAYAKSEILIRDVLMIDEIGLLYFFQKLQYIHWLINLAST